MGSQAAGKDIVNGEIVQGLFRCHPAQGPLHQAHVLCPQDFQGRSVDQFAQPFLQITDDLVPFVDHLQPDRSGFLFQLRNPLA